MIPRLWVALAADCNTGLPFQADLTPRQYAAEYGQVVVNHLNFKRDRISPYFTQHVSVGVDLCQHEKRLVRLQSDVANLGNTLELVDFGGLFSGNAIGPVAPIRLSACNDLLEAAVFCRSTRMSGERPVGRGCQMATSAAITASHAFVDVGQKIKVARN